MPTNRRIFSQDAAVSAGDADAAQGLVLHLDANDEDSIESGGANQGNGSGTWFDIANHDLVTPLADKSSNLILNLDGGIYTSGAWQDQTTNDNDAALNGDAAYNSDVRGYFTLDGTGDYLQISDNSSLNLAGGGSTYEMWFRQHTLAASEHLFGRFEGEGARDFFVSTGSSGAISLHFYDGTSSVGNIDSAGSLYTANTWHHVAVTLSSGTSGGAVILYIDGTAVGSTTLSGNRITDAAADLFLGRLGSGNAFELDGDIGTTRIYNVALTPSEVAQNFRAGNFLSYSSIYSTNLQANLDAGDTTTLTASTWSDKANSNNGTFNNFSSTLSDFYDKELGNWIDFDGSNDYLQIPASTNLDIGSGGFTYETWLLNEKSSGTSSVISNTFNVSGYTGYTLRINNGTDVQIFIYNNEAIIFDQTASSSVTTNTWTHLAFTVASASSGAAVKLYINGILSSVSGTLSGAYGGSGQNIQAGQYPFAPSGRYFNGKMGVLKFHSEELTSAEIAQNYLATKNDYPNGFNGTISGADFDTNSSSPNENYFDFSGATSDLITIPDNDLFDMQANSSMEIWLTKSSGTAHIINKKGGGTESWSLWTNGTLIYFYAYNSAGSGATTALQTSSTLNATWNHIIVTVDDALDYEIYLNGSSEATDTSLSNRLINSDTVKIGSYSGGNAYAGKVAMLKFHAKELSSSEVTANYNATKATFGL